ncbi:MAG TPA: hypothetical protein VIV09_14420 [Pseudolabrys sp.]
MTKILVSLILLFANSVAADDADEPVVMSPAQHTFLVHRLIDMQTTIDDQAKELRGLKEKLGCA